MTRKLVSLLVSLALLFACAAAFAEAAPAPEGITVVDMLGRTVELDGPAERIVAITAANVEVLYALGAGDTLVGRGAWCDYPAEARDIPAVQSGTCDARCSLQAPPVRSWRAPRRAGAAFGTTTVPPLP